MTDQPIDRPDPIPLSNDYAHTTMAVRIPHILRAIQSKNPDYAPSILQALDRLHDALQAGEPIPMLDPHPVPPSDYDAWAAAYRAQRARTEPMTWLQGEWFFTETFLYRHIVQTVRWHETGRDPFAPTKHAAYTDEHLWELLEGALALAGAPDERLHELLAIVLWGNRADLSHPAGSLSSSSAAHDDLLVDHSSRVVDHVMSSRDAGDRAPIHIVADNAGTELMMDLVLADLLVAESGSPVVLHLKSHPTFVSDATIADLWHALGVLHRHGGTAAALAERLRAAWSQQRLHLAAPWFWNSSHFLHDMPAGLRDVFSRARLVILKGDVNYRRAIADAIWPVDASFDGVMRYFPAPVVALRSVKAESLVGVPAGRRQQLDARDPSWSLTGQYGLIQFSMPERGA